MSRSFFTDSQHELFRLQQLADAVSRSGLEIVGLSRSHVVPDAGWEGDLTGDGDAFVGGLEDSVSFNLTTLPRLFSLDPHEVHIFLKDYATYERSVVSHGEAECVSMMSMMIPDVRAVIEGQRGSTLRPSFVHHFLAQINDRYCGPTIVSITPEPESFLPTCDSPCGCSRPRGP